MITEALHIKEHPWRAAAIGLVGLGLVAGTLNQPKMSDRQTAPRTTTKAIDGVKVYGTPVSPPKPLPDFKLTGKASQTGYEYGAVSSLERDKKVLQRSPVAISLTHCMASFIITKGTLPAQPEVTIPRNKPGQPLREHVTFVNDTQELVTCDTVVVGNPHFKDTLYSRTAIPPLGEVRGFSAQFTLPTQS